MLFIIIQSYYKYISISFIYMKINQTLYGHTERVWACDYSKTTLCLATCSGDKSIIIWQLN